jgi:hypothetical protein
VKFWYGIIIPSNYIHYVHDIAGAQRIAPVWLRHVASLSIVMLGNNAGTCARIESHK